MNNQTTLWSDVTQLYQHYIIMLVLLLSLSSYARAQNQQATSLNDNPMSCTLYLVAIQSENSMHSTSLYCEDNMGLSYEVVGQVAEIKNQYSQTKQIIEGRLSDRIIRMTGFTSDQAARLHAAKSKLRQQLKQAAHPKLNISQFQQSTDAIILTDHTSWSVFWDEAAFDARLDTWSLGNKVAFLASSQGTDERTALVIHVTANDFVTSGTPEALGDSVFGTDGDEVNLSSQFSACSYGQLNLIPAQGTNITDGVVQLSIDMDVQGVSRGTVRNAVVAAGNALFGSLNAQADHILFALPPNTSGGWIAYGSINGSYTTYNDRWATYVSAQMHELGHNFGMGHSGIGDNEYNDRSGMMGVSYSRDDGPRMCFNSAKSSKFTWYENKELTFYESSWSNAQNSWTGKIIGLADYADAASDQQVLLKIHTEDGNENSRSLNINFNRKTGINSGTNMGGNQVMVVSTNTPTGYNTSLLQSRLDVGESQTFENYWGSGSDLTIAVNDMVADTNSVLYAEIEISVDYNLADLIFINGFGQ